MTLTTYYDITLIEPNQSNKHITANQAFEDLATAIHDAAGIDLSVYAPLAGAVFTGAVTVPQAGVVFKEDPANGSNTATLKAAENMSASYTLKLPAAAPPTDGRVLMCGTSGESSWTVLEGQISLPSLLTSDEVSFAPITGADLFFGYSNDGFYNIKVTAQEIADFVQGSPIPQSGLKFAEATVNGVNTVTLTAPAALAGDITLSLPPDGWPYDVSVYSPDAPTASMLCARIAAARAFSLPSGLTGSVASAATAATASTVLTLYKNASSIGTVTFAAAGATGTFSFASSVSFASGDLLRIVAPATPDATLADISITFLGTRS